MLLVEEFGIAGEAAFAIAEKDEEAALRRELADLVMTEQIIRPLIEFNFGPGLVPRFEFLEVTPDAFASGRLE